jgi:hypothetical protein
MVANAKKTTPSMAKAPEKLCVFWRMKPKAYGPKNPPRLTNVVTSAIPEAADAPRQELAWQRPKRTQITANASDRDREKDNGNKNGMG